MELVLGVIAIIIAIYVIVYFVLPVASILVIITLVVSAGYALVVSLISFISSVAQNIDPYQTYVDHHANAIEGIKRNYCFGPGLHQVSQIVKGAFSNLSNYRVKLTRWKNAAIRHSWLIDIWIYLGYGFSVFCAQILGCFWVSVFSIVLTTIILTGMLIFFLFFSLLWLSDYLALLLRSIHSRCPNDKRKFVVPVFLCPTCGLPHRKLIPGPYGIVRRKCACGTKLATTFLTGRSQYEAHCPFCDALLFSSSSQQYGVQLVGGIGSGKTTFLAAFWHEYKEWLDHISGVSYLITPEDAFSELTAWYQNGNADATNYLNASMYSIIHTIGTSSPIQMTIYDIAGEAFATLGDAEIQQQQFAYCEGFLVVIDPTATPDNVSDTVASFIGLLDEVKGTHSTRMKSVPIAVLITKADLLKREIGLPHIKVSYQQMDDISTTADSLEQYRSKLCRTFLYRHGYENAVNLIEAAFSDVAFFPVSAMGHNQQNEHYEPWGVLEPVFWLMNRDHCPLQKTVRAE